MVKYLAFAILLISCGRPAYKNPHVIIKTQFGDIEVELFPEQAPRTVAAFLSYVDSGYYTNTSFYRVLKAEEFPTSNNTGIIQAGMWQTKQEKKATIPGIEHETTRQTGLTHESGTISLARTAPGTASTEFFICIGDQNSFDFGKRGTQDGLGFAAFGKVFDGMSVVRKIQDQKSKGDKFNSKINLSKITRL
jgi:peptidyl-prolyl cis-trans isomerase A (cyclophilin A)